MDGLINRQRGAQPPDPGADRDIMRAVLLLLRLTGKHVSRFIPQVPPPPDARRWGFSLPPSARLRRTSTASAGIDA